MSYKSWMCTGRNDWNTNALAFATEKEAEDYAKDLFSRWTLVEQYEVRKSDDEVNYEFVDGQLTRYADDLDDDSSHQILRKEQL